MLSSRQLASMRSVDIDACASPDLVDISRLHVNRNLPVHERIKQFVSDVGNPYLFIAYRAMLALPATLICHHKFNAIDVHVRRCLHNCPFSHLTQSNLTLVTIIALLKPNMLSKPYSILCSQLLYVVKDQQKRAFNLLHQPLLRNNAHKVGYLMDIQFFVNNLHVHSYRVN